MSKSKLSRRTLVTSAAALPALAVPALGSSDPNHPDAELLRLGAQFEPIIREYAAQTAIDEEKTAAFNAAVELATGIADRDAPEHPEGHRYRDPVPELTKENRAVWYHATRDKILHERFSGYSDEDNPWNAIHDRLDALAKDIISRKAQTVAGLAVQARAMTAYYAELWDRDEDDEDDEGSGHRIFIEAVCAFVGVTPVPLAALAGEAVQS